MSEARQARITGGHQCPVTLPSGGQCPAMIPARDLLMCGPHWGMTPGPLRRAVLRAFHSSSHGLALVRAQQAAIGAVERKLAWTAGKEPEQ